MLQYHIFPISVHLVLLLKIHNAIFECDTLSFACLGSMKVETCSLVPTFINGYSRRFTKDVMLPGQAGTGQMTQSDKHGL